MSWIREVINLYDQSERHNLIRTLYQDLDLMKYRVTAVTGGGGKTSLMFALGRHSAEYTFTLLTTTTKIFAPSPDVSPFEIVAGSDDLIRKINNTEDLPSMMTAAKEMNGGKLSGYTPEEISNIASKSRVGRMIVEADGSRGLSLKAYEAWEPPVPAVTECHFIVVGADIFRDPLSPANAFRFDIIRQKFSLQAGEMISFANCAALLSNREEYLKNSPERAVRILFINKCDLLADHMIDEIFEKLSPLLKGYDHLVMGSLKMDTIYLSGNTKR